jgi:hypothetical protein
MGLCCRFPIQYDATAGLGCHYDINAVGEAVPKIGRMPDRAVIEHREMGRSQQQQSSLRQEWREIINRIQGMDSEQALRDGGSRPGKNCRNRSQLISHLILSSQLIRSRTHIANINPSDRKSRHGLFFKGLIYDNTWLSTKQSDSDRKSQI